MQTLSGSSHFELYDMVGLPNGDEVSVTLTAHYEYDTNATVIDFLDIEWPGGNKLTNEEQNELIGDKYLHEYVVDKLFEGKND